MPTGSLSVVTVLSPEMCKRSSDVPKNSAKRLENICCAAAMQRLRRLAKADKTFKWGG
jgi:hypothetical protein